MYRTPLGFICVGPQRTASSWLHQYLKLHPAVSLPTQVKETMFFDEHFHQGPAWYDAHFDSDERGRLRGEIAPTYFDSPDALERLGGFDPLRVMVVVRNPIERTFSLFRHHRSKGRVPDDYFAAVSSMPRIEQSGRYAEHCPKWESAFGTANCIYLEQQQIQTDPQAVFDRLCGFLSIEPIELPETARDRFGSATRPRSSRVARLGAQASTALRSRGLHGPVEFAKRLGLRSLVFGKPAGEEPIPPAVWSHLRELHEPDLRFLEDKLGRSLDAWREPEA